MRFLDLFAGIGGFRLGMEMARHTCIGHVEIDKFANISYQAIHQPKKEEFYAEDITKITNETWKGLAGTVDIICAGFPCQSFSISGKRQGFNDTRGTMFFEVARAAKQIKPRFLFLENVKGLLSHKSGRTFAVILGTLDELGYDAQWRVLNSKDFGVPQNRERVFLIGCLRGTCPREIFSFGDSGSEAEKEHKPATNAITTRYGNALGSGSYIIENRKTIIQVGNINPKKEELFDGNPQPGRVYAADGISPCLNAMTGGNRIPYIISKATESIRRLTPCECWRLQGFPDWAFDRAKAAGVSDTQLYKQAGNSVTVPVIYWVARRLRWGTQPKN